MSTEQSLVGGNVETVAAFFLEDGRRGFFCQSCLLSCFRLALLQATLHVVRKANFDRVSLLSRR